MRAGPAPADGQAPGWVAGLDGVRGLAALYVVCNHVFLRTFPGYPENHAPFWASWFIYGRFAVVVFIVLSGFSLALSPARHGGRLDGLVPYAVRRARRILPAYWGALVFSLAVAWLVVPPPGQAGPDLRSVVVNGFLVQNLVSAPIPNRAFWSIAVEAQLYLLFPLLLLLLRRRGAAVMLAAVALVVAAVGILGPHIARLEVFVIQSPPDLAALFAVGVVAAVIVNVGNARRSWPWAWIAAASAAPILAVIWWQGSVWTLDNLFWIDLSLGPAVGCLFAALAMGRPAALVRLLDTRPVRHLGGSSYSLYLTHAPIVVVLYEKVVAGRVRQGAPAFLVLLALAVPATIAFARAFAAVLEQPFRRPSSVRLEARREGVAQQHDVADLTDVGKRRAAAGVPREAAVEHEPGGVGVADEDGRHHQLQLVDEVVGEELGVHVAAALDHQPLHTAGGQVRAQPAHLDRVAPIDDGCDRVEPRVGVADGPARAEDELLGVALGEERRAGIELGAPGHGHLDRRRRQAARGSLVATDR